MMRVSKLFKEVPRKKIFGTYIEEWHKKAFDYIYSNIDKEKFRCKNLKLLDIGSGEGRYLSYIKKLIPNSEVYAVDKIKYKICYADHFIRVDIEKRNIPLKSEYFDIITAFEIIEHMIIPERIFIESYRLLKNDGYLIISTPNLRAWQNIISLILGYQIFTLDNGYFDNYGYLFGLNTKPVFHIRGYTYRGLISMAKSYGFKPVKIFYCSKSQMYVEKFSFLRKIIRKLGSVFTPFKDGILLIAKKSKP